MKVLMVLTSHNKLGDTGRKTGFWLEELAAPYYTFKEVGAQITLASPKGGRPPLDPKSNEPANQTDDTRRFESDEEGMAALSNTQRLADIKQADFDTVFYPGGHGPLWDLAEDATSIALIESFLASSKPVALVCHAPGVLRHVKTSDGRPLVEGKRVTGFANTEEEAVGLTAIVPFLVEDELKEKGGIYSRGPDWSSYVVEDGLLITGQNPGSSPATARALINALSVDE
jgi:putative intracellular protease/amidase